MNLRSIHSSETKLNFTLGKLTDCLCSRANCHGYTGYAWRMIVNSHVRVSLLIYRCMTYNIFHVSAYDYDHRVRFESDRYRHLRGSLCDKNSAWQNYKASRLSEWESGTNEFKTSVWFMTLEVDVYSFFIHQQCNHIWAIVPGMSYTFLKFKMVPFSQWAIHLAPN